MKYTTYLFDFDYTLADSSRGIVICFRNVLERHKHTGISDESIKRTIGKTLEESFSILTDITDTETLVAYRKEYEKEADTYMTVNTVFFPETVTVLQNLKNQGATLGIISTKYRYRIREMLDQHFPKNFFDIVIGGEDVKKAKPNPQGIKKALRSLHRRKEETLYIGDSTVDAQAAQLAKVDFVGVLNGMTTREELAAYPHRNILENLSLLPSVNKFSPYRPNQKVPRKVILYYRWLHQKQIRGNVELKEIKASCTCKNCERTFQGTHCPHCGQNQNTPRFTIRNAFQNILSGFFNIDNGFSRNLLELLYRPGYMIRDYLRGKRVHYYKPFQTLFVLAALYIMAVQLIDPEAIKKANEEEKQDLTLNGLKDNIKLQQEKTESDTAKFYLNQSLAYVDSAQIAEENNAAVQLKNELDKELKDDKVYQIRNEIHQNIKEEIKKKIKGSGKDFPDLDVLTNEICDSLISSDSTLIAEAGMEANEYKKLKKRIRKEILKTSSVNGITTKQQDMIHNMVNGKKSLSIALDELTNHLFTDNNFFTAVANLMKSWIHGNKAFSILALLPILTLGTRWAFRRTSVGRRLNLTENFFAQVYIACQILWISLLVLPFTRQAHIDDIYDLSYSVIFALYVWDYRQLFGLSWWKSFRLTIAMLCYSMLVLAVICIIIIGTIVLAAYIIEWYKYKI